MATTAISITRGLSERTYVFVITSRRRVFAHSRDCDWRNEARGYSAADFDETPTDSHVKDHTTALLRRPYVHGAIRVTAIFRLDNIQNRVKYIFHYRSFVLGNRKSKMFSRFHVLWPITVLKFWIVFEDWLLKIKRGTCTFFFFCRHHVNVLFSVFETLLKNIRIDVKL